MAYNERFRMVHPVACAPPRRPSNLEKVMGIAKSFQTRQRIANDIRAAWNFELPALVGYQDSVGIQLLRGGHRWAAAVLVGNVMVPVIIYTKAEAFAAYDDPLAWEALLQSGAPLSRVSLG